jgi:hypothetical protein
MLVCAANDVLLSTAVDTSKVGASLALSSNASIMAIGAPDYNSYKGYVR